MNFDGFVGGTYTGLAMAADAERCINLFPERVESPGSTKTRLILLSKPGLRVFAALPGCSSVPAIAESNGRCFAVGRMGPSNLFFEILSNGAVVQYGGTLPGDSRPQLCASQTQVLILLAGNGYIFDLRANTFSPITAAGFPPGALKAGFLDGYFITLEPNSQAFGISGLNDGTQWNLLDFGDAEGEPGNVVSFIVDHRQVWFLANNHGEIYYNSGAANFPLTRLDGAFFEQGCAAIDSPAKVDNTIFWLDRNADGQGMVRRANGYSPQRVSNHSIEAIIQGYARIDDATGYCYQENGHSFYCLHFPSAGDVGTTLVYDVASNYWHERAFWNATLGRYEEDLARSHAAVFNTHLVGDWRSGTVWEQSQKFFTDGCNLIRRVRSAPDLSAGGEWSFYSELRLLMQTGMGN